MPGLSSLFWQTHFKLGEERVRQQLKFPADNLLSLLHPVLPGPLQIKLEIRGNSVCQWQKAAGSGVGFGGPGKWGILCPPSSEHSVASQGQKCKQEIKEILCSLVSTSLDHMIKRRTCNKISSKHNNPSERALGTSVRELIYTTRRHKTPTMILWHPRSPKCTKKE
jgi:hypothetical protein